MDLLLYFVDSLQSLHFPFAPLTNAPILYFKTYDKHLYISYFFSCAMRIVAMFARCREKDGERPPLPRLQAKDPKDQDLTAVKADAIETK